MGVLVNLEAVSVSDNSAGEQGMESESDNCRVFRLGFVQVPSECTLAIEQFDDFSCSMGDFKKSLHLHFPFTKR